MVDLRAEEIDSSHRSAHEDVRHLQGQNGCVSSRSLQSPIEADTVVIGTMFTVKTFDDPINLLTMEITANPIGTSMDVEIYTKLGDYQGAENDPTQWKKVVDTAVTPAHEGRGTLIPQEDFANFTMNPHELHSFFVSLKTSDLRYKSDDNFGRGQQFVSDGYLSVNAGIGLPNYGFGTQFFPSRLFCGIFHYTYVTDCNAPTSKTSVSYSFHVELKGNGASESEMIDEMNSLVGTSIQSILDNMAALRDEHVIKVERIDTAAVSESEQAKCAVATWKSCVTIESKVTLLHRSTILSGQLQYLLIQNAPEVTKQAQLGSRPVEYAGYHPLQTSIAIAFKGVPSNTLLDSEQKFFMEGAISDFLGKQTVGLMNAIVIGAKITKQRGPHSIERRIRRLQTQEASEDWVELTVDILGILVPPYVGEAGFESLIDDSFRRDRQMFMDDLKSGRHRPGSRVEGAGGDIFDSISNINVEPTRSVESNESSLTGSSAVSSQNLYIFLCIAVIAVGCGWLWYTIRGKRRQRGETDKTSSPLLVGLDSSGKRPSSIDDKTKHRLAETSRLKLDTSSAPALANVRSLAVKPRPLGEQQLKSEKGGSTSEVSRRASTRESIQSRVTQGDKYNRQRSGRSQSNDGSSSLMPSIASRGSQRQIPESNDSPRDLSRSVSRRMESGRSPSERPRPSFDGKVGEFESSGRALSERSRSSIDSKVVESESRKQKSGRLASERSRSSSDSKVVESERRKQESGRSLSKRSQPSLHGSVVESEPRKQETGHSLSERSRSSFAGKTIESEPRKQASERALSERSRSSLSAATSSRSVGGRNVIASDGDSVYSNTDGAGSTRGSARRSSSGSRGKNEMR